MMTFALSLLGACRGMRPAQLGRCSELFIDFPKTPAPSIKNPRRYRRYFASVQRPALILSSSQPLSWDFDFR